MERSEIAAYINANVHKIANIEVEKRMIIIHFVNGDSVDITAADYNDDLYLQFEKAK